MSHPNGSQEDPPELPAKNQFCVQINGGPEQILEVRTGVYKLAALASLAILEYESHDDYDVVKIWVPRLVAVGYGPYFVAWDGSTAGLPTDDRKW